MYKHVDRLFTFLTTPAIDATHWRAEQAIRPAVVNRKVWGNRTPTNAPAQAVLMSVWFALRCRGRDGLTSVSQVL